jgi:hypothetical protein
MMTNSLPSWTIGGSSCHAALFLVPVFGLVTLFGVFLVVKGAREGWTLVGWARGQGGAMRVTRAENPILFWSSLLIYLCAAAWGAIVTGALVLHILKISKSCTL